jgi:hypothetical protein
MLSYYMNMQFKRAFLIFILCFVVALTGCATRIASFTVVSTRNIDWSRAAEFVRHDQRISGEDLYGIIIFAPTKAMVYIDVAIENALRQIPGAVALIDAVLIHKNFYFPFLYGESGYIIEGSVLFDPALREKTRPGAGYLLFHTTDGETYYKREITREEYDLYSVKETKSTLRRKS